MSPHAKQISSPFSTGGGGAHFEAHIQASFVILMLVGGFAPCLPCWPIKKIKLQGKYAGYDTDDLIVFLENVDANQKCKMLAQIKHSIGITEGDKEFGEVIQAAWADFNNPAIFTKNKDVIALISGPLSAADIADARTILDWARSFENSTEYFNNISLANFSSSGKRSKLKAFREHLKRGNGGNDVGEEETYQFLKHFHLLAYDLDIKAGVILSLVHSLIGQYSQGSPQGLWAQIVNEVQSANKNAGTITIDSLPVEIREAFKVKVEKTIPKEYSKSPLPVAPIDWSQNKYASELAIANLIGAWNEQSAADIAIIRDVVKEDPIFWISKCRELLLQPQSLVTLSDGVWAVKERQYLWSMLGSRLFDDHLDIFNRAAITILTERDPQFDLPPEERYAAYIHGKILKHSPYLRKGLAEGLVLLGAFSKALSNCSEGKSETIVALTVRKIFENADWVLWGSLNDLLPLLAEADPDEFLKAVENALLEEPCPFSELFDQEGDGVFGRNYLTGLLWALETLAWDEHYLVRVSVILADLASRDPGGRWANRADNSLTTIFLPWFPQTMAPIEKRKVALKTIQREFPEVAWKILSKLLPNQHQMSTGSHKPIWRNPIPEGYGKEVTRKEYWDQVSSYADMAVEIAKADIEKLSILVDSLNNLPLPSFNELLVHLASERVRLLPEENRVKIWMKLVSFVTKHKRFAGSDWAMSPDLLSKIEYVAKALAPQNPKILYIRLFGRDSDLYEENGKWEEQSKKLELDRQKAIEEILVFAGIEGVIQFAESVESPWNVGFSFGVISDSKADSAILPTRLDDENKKSFVGGYVWGKFQSAGWLWVDQVDCSGWTLVQTARFFAYLPFTFDAWKRLKVVLGDHEGEYWRIVPVNPYQAEGQIMLAVDKLMEFGRPHAAINCLYKTLGDKQPLDEDRAIRALLLAVSSKEPSSAMDVYHIVDIIKKLQEASTTDQDELFKIEWAYLQILDRHHDATPKLLESRLATDPNFFCEIIRHIYRSKNEPKSDEEPSEAQKAIATNVWRLLYKWSTPPGLLPDGSISGDHFNKWLESVKAACSVSGHLEVALTHVGSVLFHCPPDPTGLWIDRIAADALNGKDAEKMRNGFSTAIYNSRGAHWVDPTGKPERDLAVKYTQQAEDVENAGFQRLASTLRGIAESYDRQADKIIAEHKAESADV